MPSAGADRLVTFEDGEVESEYGYVRKVRVASYFVCGANAVW